MEIQGDREKDESERCRGRRLGIKGWAEQREERRKRKSSGGGEE